jgi:hypothetical protein
VKTNGFLTLPLSKPNKKVLFLKRYFFLLRVVFATEKI